MWKFGNLNYHKKTNWKAVHVMDFIPGKLLSKTNWQSLSPTVLRKSRKLKLLIKNDFVWILLTQGIYR